MRQISDKKMTLQEVSKQTGAAYRTVAKYAQEAGWTENGKTTYLDELQVGMIVEAMKQSTSGGAFNTKNNNLTLHDEMQGIRLHDMKVGMAIQLEEIRLQQEELNRRAKKVLEEGFREIERENAELAIKIGESESYKSTIEVRLLTGEPEKNWRPLRDYSLKNGYSIKRTRTREGTAYGYINSYHLDVWYEVYGIIF
jgi:hypothetical protein